MTDNDSSRSGNGQQPRRSDRPMPPSVAPKRVSTRGAQPGTPEPVVDPTQVMPAQPASGTYSGGSRGPYESDAPVTYGAESGQRPPRRRRKHRCRWWFLVILGALVAAAVIFFVWAQSQIQTVPALSGAPDTPGLTYLIVGSDSREGWELDDGTTGARTDTIMVLHKPESGPVALISIPRDSYVEIPGHGSNKINAAFAFGGPQLLVETVELHTGLTVDHFLEIGLTGVAELVDAVGGVELCYDQDVSDKNSRLEWEAGCHVVDGETALAFSRMRYSDPLGDIGRTQRQQQLVKAVADEIMSPATFLNPVRLVRVVSTGLDAFRVSEGTGIFDIARMALVLNSGLSDGAVSGTPPIRDMGYSVDGVGSTVLLDPDQIDQFWDDIANGAYEPGTEVGGVG